MIINFQVDEAKVRKRILNDNEDKPIEKITQLTSNELNFSNNDQRIVQEKVPTMNLYMTLDSNVA